MRGVPFMAEYVARTDVVRTAERKAAKRGCCLCGSPRILRLVDGKGYCGAHTAEAFAAALARVKGRRRAY